MAAGRVLPLLALSAGVAVPVPAAAFATPVEHVVIVYQENHSFDNVLGLWCAQTSRCDGVTSGRISTGETMALGQATDVVPNVDHGPKAQTRAIDGGKMISSIASADAGSRRTPA